jgi:hypothetical protein
VGLPGRSPTLEAATDERTPQFGRQRERVPAVARSAGAVISV